MTHASKPGPRQAALRAALALIPLATALPAQAAPSYTIIFNFDGADQGANPTQIIGMNPGAKAARGWAIYGSTPYGGGAAGGAKCAAAGGCGTVYQLIPPAKGSRDWLQTILHVFTGGTDGNEPFAAPIPGANGGLYGTTGYGGLPKGNGNGTIFTLTPPAQGQTGWAKSTLYAWKAATEGSVPVASLTLGTDGALYGTTWHGGANADGTVFRLAPPPSGKTAWSPTTLYSFTGGLDGAFPLAPLTTDPSGVFYGTTNFQGQWGNGAVYSMTPPAPGATAWTNTPIAPFTGPGGALPSGALVRDEAGNLYGTTRLGGAYGYGGVFEFSPPAQGGAGWTETVLYSFTGAADGALGGNPLLRTANGVLYGVASAGGSATDSAGSGCGAVFKLTPPKHGKTVWTETVLHSFAGGSDGCMGDGLPPAGLISGPGNTLYGTTFNGGSQGFGIVFRIVL